MRIFFRLVALGLALIWLPATMCCSLEAAGWNILCSDSSCHDRDSGQAAEDGCNLIENGHYQSTVPSLKTAPPVTTLCACLIHLCAYEPDFETQQAVVVAVESERPRDWVPIWQFERRAAALAHAP